MIPQAAERSSRSVIISGRALSLEWATDKVSANVVAPRITETEAR
jgi:hypothetical protein